MDNTTGLRSAGSDEQRNVRLFPTRLGAPGLTRRLPVLVFALVVSQIVLGAGSLSQQTTDEVVEPGHRGAVSASSLASATDQILNEAGSSPTVGYSLVEGGLSDGTVDEGGNLQGDPIRANPNGADGIPGTVDDGVELQLGSSAINAGSDAALPADIFDIDGDGDTSEPFPVDYNGLDRRYDDGGGAGSVDIGANERRDKLVAVEPPVGGRKPQLELVGPFPNPMSSSGILRFTMPVSERVEVAVYDVLGRRRLLLYDDVARRDEPVEVRIATSQLPNGVYFARLHSASFDGTTNFVVVR